MIRYSFKSRMRETHVVTTAEGKTDNFHSFKFISILFDVL